MYSVDIQAVPNIEEATAAAQTVGVEHAFILANSAALVLPRPVDLLFVDTWHVFAHLRSELNQHQGRVRRYIILHDTEVDHDNGESVRFNRDTVAEARLSGYPEHEIRRGLWPAVEEFLQDHPEWQLQRHWANNNGLSVLKRWANIKRMPVSKRNSGFHTPWLIVVGVLVLAGAIMFSSRRKYRIQY